MSSASRFSEHSHSLLEICDGLSNASSFIQRANCHTASLLGFISAVILPIICSFGLVSNALVAIIFLAIQKSPTRQMTYFGCLAVSDFFILIIFVWLDMFASKGLPYLTNGRQHFFPPNQSSLACRLHRSIIHLLTTFSANITLAMAIDRFLCVTWPRRFSHLPRFYRWYIMSTTLAVSVIMIIPTLFYFDLRVIRTLLFCWVHPSEIGIQIYLALFSNSCAAQLLITAALNVKLLLQLRRTATNPVLNHSSPGQRESSSNSREMTACLTLVNLSVSAMLSALPQTITNLCFIVMTYQSINVATELSRHISLINNITNILWILILSQISTIIFVYTSMMKGFRRSLIWLVTFKWLREKFKSKSDSLQESTIECSE